MFHLSFPNTAVIIINVNYYYVPVTLLLQVTVLMSVDLLRQQQRWKDALVDIRQMMATLVQEVCYAYLRTHIIGTYVGI